MPRRPDQPRTQFTASVRAARIAAGYATQRAAADAAGMLPSNWNRLEKDGQSPLWGTMAAIITRLRLPLEYFFPAEHLLAAAARIVARNRARERARSADEKAPQGRETLRGSVPETAAIVEPDPAAGQDEE